MRKKKKKQDISRLGGGSGDNISNTSEETSMDTSADIPADVPTDVTGAEQTPVDVTGVDQNPADIAGAEQNTADVTGVDQNPADIAGAEQNPADIAGTEQTPADVTGIEQTPAEEAGTEQNTAEDTADTAGGKSGKPGLAFTVIIIAAIVIFLFVIFIGVIVVFYPQISNFVNTKNASKVIGGYQEALSELSEVDYAAYLEAARAYNARLSGSAATINDAFSDAADDSDRTDEYWSLLDVAGNGMMGYIEIEQLDISLPIYHGTSDYVLSLGAGHIQGTSLPVGGGSTNSAISAHTGLPRAQLFTGVDTLVVGDTFTLYVLNMEFTYEIDQILTVLPYETEALQITAGEDYMTLVTCTPYGINTHRLLIRGTLTDERIVETKQLSNKSAANDGSAEVDTSSWFDTLINRLVEFFSTIVERIAEKLVEITEWAMDMFDVEY